MGYGVAVGESERVRIGICDSVGFVEGRVREFLESKENGDEFGI